MLLPLSYGGGINDLNRPEEGFEITKTNASCPITSVADFIEIGDCMVGLWEYVALCLSLDPCLCHTSAYVTNVCTVCFPLSLADGDFTFD